MKYSIADHPALKFIRDKVPRGPLATLFRELSHAYIVLLYAID